MTGEYLGRPFDRVDGRAKVTGHAHYSAETQPGEVLFGGLVTSSIAKGKIVRIDTTIAESFPGVVGILDQRNAPKCHRVETFPRGPAGETVVPLQGPEIYYAGQPIGLVVAQTIEAALTAALLVKVEYEEAPPVAMDAALARESSFPPSGSIATKMGEREGEIDQIWAQAEHRLASAYDTAANHPSAMELHATVAHWNGDKLEVTDASQWPLGVRFTIATMLGIPKENIHVTVPYVGGAFGGKVLTYAHTILTVIAAQRYGKVKTILTRDQVMNVTGYRPQAHHHFRLTANASGQFGLLEHTGVSQTSENDRYLLPFGEVSAMLYECGGRKIEHWLLPTNSPTPCTMRAPGESSGMFVLESAVDEMAWKLGIDPIELRRRNMPATHPSGKRWSSHELMDCFDAGAKAFNWSKPSAPKEQSDGDWWLGQGTASACYGSYRSQAALRLTLYPDGSVIGATATSEIGNGVETVLTQILCEELGLAPQQVRLQFGDTDFPAAPVIGASRTTTSLGPVVLDAVWKLKQELAGKLTQDVSSPLTATPAKELRLSGGKVFSPDGAHEPVGDILARHGLASLSVEGFAGPKELDLKAWEILRSGVNTIRFPVGAEAAMYSFGAHFVSLRVHKRLRMVKVDRIVGRYAAGRILNPKGARNQILGGLVFGLGQALSEQIVYHPRDAKSLNANLADYRIPVSADMPEFDIGFLGEADPFANDLGVKSVGELGTAGIAAAIGNAVFHATGIRPRRIPILPDSLTEN